MKQFHASGNMEKGRKILPTMLNKGYLDLNSITRGPSLRDTLPSLLDLADNLACLGQGFHHLQTLFPTADGVVALFEQVLKLVLTVHVLKKFSLHFFFGKSSIDCQEMLKSTNP